MPSVISQKVPLTELHCHLGGAVSPGASAWFYYDLPPGDYAVGSGDHNDNFDWFFIMGLVQRVHVS